MKKENISVSALSEDVLTLVAAAGKKEKVALHGPSNHRTLAIETDPEILKSIIGCFLSNAVNYSEPGKEVVLEIEEEKDDVVFLVRDNGIGIPKDEQHHIFEKFYRASNAKEIEPNGTGLGLYMASMLAGKIGAKISFESEKDKGSVFYLRIPKRSNENA